MTAPDLNAWWARLPAIWKAGGVAVAIILTFANLTVRASSLTALPDRVESLESRVESIELKMTADSARQERMLCIQEVMAGLRPDIDLQTRCAR